MRRWRLSRRVQVDAIGDALPHIPRRTLQRLLGELVESGQLARIGKDRATLYMLVAVIESAPVADDYTSYIQLSEPAARCSLSCANRWPRVSLRPTGANGSKLHAQPNLLSG